MWRCGLTTTRPIWKNYNRVRQGPDDESHVDHGKVWVLFILVAPGNTRHGQGPLAGEGWSESCVRRVTGTWVKSGFQGSSAGEERSLLPASAAQVRGVASAPKQPQWEWRREDNLGRRHKGTIKRVLSPMRWWEWFLLHPKNSLNKMNSCICAESCLMTWNMAKFYVCSRCWEKWCLLTVGCGVLLYVHSLKLINCVFPSSISLNFFVCLLYYLWQKCIKISHHHCELVNFTKAVWKKT